MPEPQFPYSPNRETGQVCLRLRLRGMSWETPRLPVSCLPWALQDLRQIKRTAQEEPLLSVSLRTPSAWKGVSFFPPSAQLQEASSFKSPACPNSNSAASCSSGLGIRPWHAKKEEPSSGVAQILSASAGTSTPAGPFCKLAAWGPAPSVSGHSEVPSPPVCSQDRAGGKNQGLQSRGFQGKEVRMSPRGRADGGRGEAASVGRDGGRWKPCHFSAFLTHPRPTSSHCT